MFSSQIMSICNTCLDFMPECASLAFLNMLFLLADTRKDGGGGGGRG